MWQCTQIALCDDSRPWIAPYTPEDKTTTGVKKSLWRWRWPWSFSRHAPQTDTWRQCSFSHTVDWTMWKTKTESSLFVEPFTFTLSNQVLGRVYLESHFELSYQMKGETEVGAHISSSTTGSNCRAKLQSSKTYDNHKVARARAYTHTRARARAHTHHPFLRYTNMLLGR